MKRVIKPAIIYVIVGLCLGLLYFYINPATSYLMPKCPFKMLTGYDCPSCGIQRLSHQLLHGNLTEAFLLNPFIFVAAPYLFLAIYAAISRDRFAQKVRRIVSNHITISIYITLYILWWIVRNSAWWHNLLQ